MTIRTTMFDSPLGPVRVQASPLGLTAITFLEGDGASGPPKRAIEDAAALAEAVDQLRAYFAGQRTAFDLPLDPGGTPFQRAVWAALQTIPFGSTRSYSEIAQAIDRPRAVRAVGAANGRNPLPIVIPCHRVIGRDGTLTGYRGGVRLKRALLTLEGAGLPLSGG